MKKVLSGIALIAIIVLAFSSCADPEASALLTDGAWKFSDMTTDSEDETIQGLVFLSKALMTNATIEFQEGGDYLITFADELQQDPESGTWSLVGEDQLILTSEEGVPSTANIDELSKDKLKYIETYVDEELNSYSLTTTWKK